MTEQELMADLEAKALELLPCPAGFIAESWERVKELWNTRMDESGNCQVF